MTKQNVASRVLLEPKLLEKAEHFIAVYKPPGWVVVRPSKGTPSLLEWVRTECGNQHHPVHRLDKLTSGLVLFASTPYGKHTLEAQFKDRSLKKHYLVHCPAAPTIDKQQVDIHLHPIDRVVDGTKRSFVEPVQDKSERYRPDRLMSASTYFRPLAQSADAQLVWAQPRTGRRHQIRAHMQWLGCPITGDKLYGSTSEWPISSSIGLIAVGITQLKVKGCPSSVDLKSESPQLLNSIIDEIGFEMRDLRPMLQSIQ